MGRRQEGFIDNGVLNVQVIILIINHCIDDVLVCGVPVVVDSHHF